MKRAVACVVLALSLLGPSAATASSAPSTPQSRLLNVWLDLSLLGIFYPDTTPETFLPNLKKIAGQLNQPLPPIHFGESPRDSLKFHVGAVVIKHHPPRDTFILYTRSRTQVWELIDGPTNQLRIFRVASRK